VASVASLPETGAMMPVHGYSFSMQRPLNIGLTHTIAFVDFSQISHSAHIK
jgi:hypothetical protein